MRTLAVIVLCLMWNVASAQKPGIRLMGNLPDNLTNEQILRAVWTALAGRRWVVQSSSDDTVVAEYSSGDTAGKLKVFLVGRELRYTDEGTRQKIANRPTTLPESWIANLRNDTAKHLRELSLAQRPSASPAKSTASASSRAVAERLRAAKELHDSGVITADEYEKKRAEILRGL